MEKEYYCARCGRKMKRASHYDKYDRYTGKIVSYNYVCIAGARHGHDWYYVDAETGKVI